MVAPRRVQQQHLGHRVPAFVSAGEQQLTNRLRAGRAARLAREQRRNPAAPQRGDEGIDLGGFPCSLPAFDRDETAAGGFCHGALPGQFQLPQIMCPATPAIRPSGPRRSTSAAATRGVSAGAISGIVTTILPRGWPLLIGAATG